jgi:TonB family protein
VEIARHQREEAMKQVREAMRQQAQSNRLMARNEMRAMPSTPAPPVAPTAPSQDAAKPVKIESAIMAGQVRNKVQPKYPQSAKDAHISGAVVLQAIIDETGVVQQLRLVSSPDKDLATSAMDAVRQWTYRPYLLNGNPTPVETTITVNFSFAGAELVRPSGPTAQLDRPVLLTQVDPVMPYQARQRFYSDGLVTLRVRVGSTGKIDAVQATTSPDPLLFNAAMDAVKQWRFQPAVQNGVPVAREIAVKVNFGIL